MACRAGPGPWASMVWCEGSGADASGLLPLLPVAVALTCTPAGRGSCMTTVRGSHTRLLWQGFPHANVVESLAQPGCGWGVCGSGEVTVSSRQHVCRMFPSNMTSSLPARPPVIVNLVVTLALVDTERIPFLTKVEIHRLHRLLSPPPERPEVGAVTNASPRHQNNS